MINSLYLQLGFDKIAQSICNSKDKKCFVIIGEYKQGKTALLEHIKNHLLNVETRLGKIIPLSKCPDPILCVEEYSPYVQFISNNEDLQSKRAQAYVQAVGGDFGKLSKRIVKLLNVRSIYSKLYNATETTLLEDLEKITNRCPAVFICDDVDKWDWASIGLLKKLMEDTSTNWVKNSTFIFSVTSSDETLKLLDIENNRDIFEIFRLSNLSKTATENYAKAVNSHINCDELFAFTKGNLGETYELIEYFNQVGDTAIFKNIQEMLRNKIKDQISRQYEYDAKTNKQLIQQEANSTINIINRSSIIGERFQRAILQELSQEEDSFAKYLSYILSSGIYGQQKTELYFTYSMVYKRLHEYNQNQLQYHSLFAKALQKITPSNFRLRAQELLLSKSNDWMAAVTYFNYIINYSKKYQSSSPIETHFIKLLAEFGLYDRLISLQNAYNYYFQGKFAKAASLLPCKTMQMEIDFQIDYLKCLILVNRNIIKSDYRDAALILLPWVESSELCEDEPYLWIQGTILYNEIMSEIAGKPVKETQIMNMLLKYSTVDLEFRIEYYDYLAKNNYTYTIENQYDMTGQAVKFFEENTWIVGKALYARAIVNHVGNAIVMGEYSEAIKLSNDFFKMLSEYSETRNQLLVATNNYFVALVLSESEFYSQASNFAEFYESALPSIQDDGITSVLFKINYGLMLFLSNQDEKAMTVYDELYNWICNEKDVDDYYRFFIINNYMLIKGYMNKDWGVVSFEELDSLNPCPNNAQFVIRHTQMLKDKTFGFASKNDLMTPMGESILGKAWSFWGRPLLFTDIQSWSD